MTDDCGATALAERIRLIVSSEAKFNPAWPEGWAKRSAAAILGEYGRFLPDGRDAERLREARAYVANNLVVWDDDDGTVVGAAVADVFRKVLNVIDTGNPMTALEGADR